MASARAREQRREKRRVQRRRAAQRRRAGQTQQRQAVAARGENEADRRRRHRIAYLLWIPAAILGAVDLLDYTGLVAPVSRDAAIVLLGAPAVLLALVGAIVYGT